MLQTHSSPAAEGRSPVPPRCTTAKKVVCCDFLQFAAIFKDIGQLQAPDHIQIGQLQAPDHMRD
jgi:hypothetical protein